MSASLFYAPAQCGCAASVSSQGLLQKKNKKKKSPERVFWEAGEVEQCWVARGDGAVVVWDQMMDGKWGGFPGSLSVYVGDSEGKRGEQAHDGLCESVCQLVVPDSEVSGIYHTCATEGQTLQTLANDPEQVRAGTLGRRENGEKKVADGAGHWAERGKEGSGTSWFCDAYRETEKQLCERQTCKCVFRLDQCQNVVYTLHQDI